MTQRIWFSFVTGDLNSLFFDASTESRIKEVVSETYVCATNKITNLVFIRLKNTITRV